jgi:farnesyl-diphosphate farnesyltransferase
LGKNSDLDDYTYRVAGCVGEFWTRICRAHVFPNARLEDKVLLEQSVRFGKGLQLVNILRDIAADLRLGRCYLPLEKLTEVGLTPDALLDPRNESKLRPVYNQYLELACEHLMAGWAYTTALPWKNARVRLACAWPILIGLETVKLLRKSNVLEPAQRAKINRKAVKKWIWRSVFYYPVPSLWRALAQP